MQVGQGRAELQHNEAHLGLIQSPVVSALVVLVELVQVHRVILKHQVCRGLRDDAVEQAGDIRVFQLLQDLQLSGGDVVKRGVLEGDYFDGERPLRLLADSLVDSTVGALPDLLDEFEGRHLPKFIIRPE